MEDSLVMAVEEKQAAEGERVSPLNGRKRWAARDKAARMEIRCRMRELENETEAVGAALGDAQFGIKLPKPMEAILQALSIQDKPTPWSTIIPSIAREKQIHQNTLTSAMKRCVDLGYVEKTDLGYSILPDGYHAMMRKSDAPDAQSTAWARPTPVLTPAPTLDDSIEALLSDVLARLSAPPRPNIPDTARRIFLEILEHLPPALQDALAPITQIVTVD